MVKKLSLSHLQGDFKLLSYNFNCFKTFPNHTLTACERSGTNAEIIFKVDNFKQKELLEQRSSSQSGNCHTGVVGKNDLLPYILLHP